MKVPKLRFSIRTLLIATFAISIVVWWLSAPSACARRFIALIESKKRTEAAEMFMVPGHNSMLTEWEPIVEVIAWTPKRWTLQEMLRGRRKIELAVSYKQSANKVIEGYFPLSASFRGIHALNATRDVIYVDQDDTAQ